MKKIQSPLTINEVSNFLNENKKSFLEVVENTECRKWSKWIARNETPFPCVCPVRNEDCIFAEIYYELSKVAEISKFEKDCEDAILNFQITKNNDAMLKDWIEQFENLHSQISQFKSIITVTISPEPYEKLKIQVNFPTVIEDFEILYSSELLSSQ